MPNYTESHTKNEDQVSVKFLAKLLSMSRVQIEEHLFENKNAEQISQLHILLEAIEKIIKWSGSRNEALSWYRFESIPAFGGRTAEFIVKSGELQIVLDYINHLELGGYS